MPQVFHRASNSIAKTSIAAIVLGIGALGWAAYEVNDSAWFTYVSIVREQPVPFSHAHHVGQLGIDCRYCHQSVEVSSFAGFPPTQTCISCHSQIWSESPMLEPVRASYRNNIPLRWTRVYDLPDFVYFDHSIHINKGIGCVSCHGRVDQMPLLYRETSLHMQWCLSCHRAPENFVRPREHVFDMAWTPVENQQVMGARLVKDYKIRKLTDCYTCHR